MMLIPIQSKSLRYNQRLVAVYWMHVDLIVSDFSIERRYFIKYGL